MEFKKKKLSADELLELVRITLKEKQIRDKPNVKYSLSSYVRCCGCKSIDKTGNTISARANS